MRQLSWEELMNMWSCFAKAVLAPAVAGLCVLALTPDARAQNTIDPDAQSVLVAMSNYLGGLKSFSVELSAIDEIVTPEGQKLQFLSSGEVVAQRPDKLYAKRGAQPAQPNCSSMARDSRFSEPAPTPICNSTPPA
jgi:hypothetical protein